MGATELAVAQVKKYKPSAKASDKRGFQEVVNQLQQAAEEEIPNIDGKKYKPAIVYFITPFPVETRALQARFERYASLRITRTKIIDGPLVVKLARQNIPGFEDRILGTNRSLRKIVTEYVSNETLLRALGYYLSKDIRTFYSDLDLCFDASATQLLLAGSAPSEMFGCHIKRNEWDDLQKLCHFAFADLGISLLDKSIEDVNSEFARIAAFDPSGDHHYAGLETSIERSSLESANTREGLRELREGLAVYISRKHPDSPGLGDKLIFALSELENTLGQDIQAVRKFAETKLKISQISSPSEGLPDGFLDQYYDRIDALRKSEIEIRRLQSSRMKRINELRGPDTVNVTIDTRPIAQLLHGRRMWLDWQILQFMEHQPSTKDLAAFLEDCHKIFLMAKRFLSNCIIAEALGFNRQPTAPHGLKCRVPRDCVTVFSVCSVAVLCEPGGGPGLGRWRCSPGPSGS